jgi:predicted  nucleic acid-binding Zn-ribbon protein
MEKEIAKKIMIELERLEDVMNDIAAIIEDISNEEEKKKFRREIADLMIRSFTKIMHPIIREHDELDPDIDTEWFKEIQKKRKSKKVIQIKTKQGT